MGEASHPGPPVAARRSQDSTSDDEPLSGASERGRDVVPRRHREDVAVGSRGCMETLLDSLEEDLAVGNSEMSATVPATPGALAEAGAVPEVCLAPVEEICASFAIRSDAEGL